MDFFADEHLTAVWAQRLRTWNHDLRALRMALSSVERSAGDRLQADERWLLASASAQIGELCDRWVLGWRQQGTTVERTPLFSTVLVSHLLSELNLQVLKPQSEDLWAVWDLAEGGPHWPHESSMATGPVSLGVQDQTIVLAGACTHMRSEDGEAWRRFTARLQRWGGDAVLRSPQSPEQNWEMRIPLARRPKHLALIDEVGVVELGGVWLSGGERRGEVLMKAIRNLRYQLGDPMKPIYVETSAYFDPMVISQTEMFQFKLVPAPECRIWPVSM